VQAFSFIVLAHEAHSDWKIQSPSQLTLIDTHTVNSASTSVDLGYIVFCLFCISSKLWHSVHSWHLAVTFESSDLGYRGIDTFVIVYSSMRKCIVNIRIEQIASTFDTSSTQASPYHIISSSSCTLYMHFWGEGCFSGCHSYQKRVLGRGISRPFGNSQRK
jgi:hypothetical protein